MENIILYISDIWSEIIGLIVFFLMGVFVGYKSKGK